MCRDSEPDYFIDVAAQPIFGRIGTDASSEKMKSDAALIRTYIRAEKEVAASALGPKSPSIARAVLTCIWEAPRIGFHADALLEAGFPKGPFSNKLLLIPWSIEAFNHWKANLSVSGLTLEHVTPIDWMWQELKKLDTDPDDGSLVEQDQWELAAANYLFHHYMLAVVTDEQAGAIDRSGYKKTGVPLNPFLRYALAETWMNENRGIPDIKPVPTFSTKRFVLPGPRDRN
jgi:hypothetical protein